MITLDQARTLQGKTMHGSGGEKLGKIDTLYADREGGEPTFATVHTGAFGTKTSFVPLDEATMTGDERHGALRQGPRQRGAEDRPGRRARARRGGAPLPALRRPRPRHGTTGTDRLHGRPARPGRRPAPPGPPAPRTATSRTGPTTHGTVGHDTSGPDHRRRDDPLRGAAAGRHAADRGRPRPAAQVHRDRERQTQTVPVSREEVRIEREPITEGNRGAAYDGPALSEEEHEVVLHAEKPVVAKETVPVERVRLGTETVRDEVTVNEQVRKEQIDTDGVVPRGRPRPRGHGRRARRR